MKVTRAAVWEWKNKMRKGALRALSPAGRGRKEKDFVCAERVYDELHATRSKLKRALKKNARLEKEKAFTQGNLRVARSALAFYGKEAGDIKKNSRASRILKKLFSTTPKRPLKEA